MTIYERRVRLCRQMALVAIAAAVAASSIAVAAQNGNAIEPQGTAIDRALAAAHQKYRTLQEGKNADYIPALAKVDPNLFGIALVTADGKVYIAGDAKSEVSIQSISKPFTAALVMEETTEYALPKSIRLFATGQPINSIVRIEQ